MKILFKVFIFLGLILIYCEAYSQDKTSDDIENFYFDAVVFQSDSAKMGRIDVMVIVPYQTLNFIKNGKIFGASFELEIIVTDTNGTKIDRRVIQKSIREEEYFVTKGGTAKFTPSQTTFYLAPGKYRINTKVSDSFSKQTWEKNRVVTVLDFSEFDFALSGIMLLSSVEETGGKFKITPHLSDNTGNLTSGYFAFFESYKHKFEGDSVDYIWEIVDTKNEVIAFSNRIRKPSAKKTQQNFIKIPKVSEMKNGTYILRLTALEPDTVSEIKNSKILAITQRSINNIRTIGGNVMGDFPLSVKQLRYVAFQSDIDYINEGKTQEDKENRFEQFWKKMDPSPGTDRNEAFEEYYSRISFANSAFKSYQEGWMTDKGMVYIIFGPPANNEKTNNMSDNRVYERWTYLNNREFVFVDNSGFGDFRMVRPISVTEKYKYTK